MSTALDAELDEEVFDERENFVEEEEGDLEHHAEDGAVLEGTVGTDDKVDWASALQTSAEVPEVHQARLLAQPMLDGELTATKQGILMRNIKVLYCFLAKDSVTAGPTTSTRSILEQISIAFCDLMKGNFTRKEYWHNNLYDHFGGKHPLFFDQWINHWLEKLPPNKFKQLKYVTGKPLSMQQILWNGFRIQQEANKHLKLINNRVNPLWLNTLPSGHTFASQFQDLRERVWVPVARARVHTNAGAYRRRNANKGLSAQELDQRHFNELIRSPDRSWFPDWWLLFSLCAKPAARFGMQRQSLNSGGAIARVDGGLLPLTNNEDVGGLLQSFQQSTSRRGQQAMIAAGLNPSADAPAGGGGSRRSLASMLPTPGRPDPNAPTYRTPGRGRGGTPFLGPIWAAREEQRDRSRSRDGSERGSDGDGPSLTESSDNSSGRLHQLMVQYQQQQRSAIDIQLEAMEAQINDHQSLLAIAESDEERADIRGQLRAAIRERIELNRKKMEEARK